MPATETARLIRTLEEIALRNGIDPRPFGGRLTALASAAPDPLRATRNLSRFLDTGFSSSLIADFSAYPVLLEVFFELVGQSQYLADILVRDPELLRWLTASGELKRSRTATDLSAELADAVALFSRPERKLDAVRRFQRREILRLGSREILKEADVVTITAELSALADASAQAVSAVVHADLNARLGTDLPNKMAVLGLGKLGGQELNFSSDIDLIFVYDEDGELPQPAGRLRTFHEYYTRLAESIVRGLSEFSSEGHLYRVDMRLRPDGRSGPLAMSRGAMMAYYESRGASWERQMLLKARPIAGAVEVGERFLQDLRPFLFPRTALRSPWADIADMKRAIEQNGVDEGNIKLGAGGIRDIEFLVQGLQLLYAGNDPELRTGHTLRAMERLVQTDHLPRPVSDKLRTAYEFFRVVEHRLQLLHGHQTHQIPETKEETRVLARKLGFQNADAFRAHLTDLREFVRSQFLTFTTPRSSEVVPTLPEAITETVHRATSVAGWPDAVREVVRKRLESAFASGSMHRLLEAALRSPDHRSWLLQTALGSSRMMERFAAEPLLVESLVGNAHELLRSAAPGWASLRETDLRRYGLYNEARTAVRFLAGKASVPSVQHELTELAEEILRRVADRKVPKPSGIAILALGKLGGGEMGFGSDLDLVSVFDDRFCPRDQAEEFSRALAKELTQELALYKVDFRLRPEGRNAPLAVEVGYLRTYLESRAEPWERMALARARIIWGDRRFGATSLRTLRALAFGPIPHAGLYLRRMRSVMEQQRVRDGGVDLKVSAGGIADVEFIAQGLALEHPGLMGISTDSVLQKSIDRKWLPRKSGASLRSGLNTLRKVEMLTRLNAQAAVSTLPAESDVRSCLALSLGQTDARQFLRFLKSTMRDVRASFQAFCGTLSRRRRGKS